MSLLNTYQKAVTCLSSSKSYDFTNAYDFHTRLCSGRIPDKITEIKCSKGQQNKIINTDKCRK